ncbi:AAA-ATPase [Quillaja saponaria]|uniref:AAA-ATPase n=1 Tax=Quillaja saponaria TaxID=32244 RepID=A0AAD7L7H6_QUISA|nr:AAA-ATPase [Quillaja saponaria]
MANCLKFDVYDLELTELNSNSELRRLLISMANRSILVVEDIDCTIEFHGRMAEFRAASRGAKSKQVTLSGPCGFRQLAGNCPGIKEHILFGEIAEAIQTTPVTPAEVAEQQMKGDDHEATLRDLIEFLKVKKEENEKAQAEKGKAASISEEGPSEKEVVSEKAAYGDGIDEYIE